jgi:hypothetical protein
MNEIHRHDHPEPTPEVDVIQVTRVVFRRGHGCCEESPVRIVEAYFYSDGNLLVEKDPVA